MLRLDSNALKIWDGMFHDSADKTLPQQIPESRQTNPPVALVVLGKKIEDSVQNHHFDTCHTERSQKTMQIKETKVSAAVRKHQLQFQVKYNTMHFTHHFMHSCTS